ncbi:11870_t:CDS:2 [Scutellospora calospora]|uniref:11870_t:CDS:1 n=1 Tax=Scutellospora calospora TaxID=85575 RepID=A0ACA9KI25_9GLOM|nr:11870_t:CDS:2 [Scutellospora calospora]
MNLPLVNYLQNPLFNPHNYGITDISFSFVLDDDDKTYRFNIPEGSQQYFNYLSNNTSTDVIIEAGEEPNSKRFMAHKNILQEGSSFFKCVLSSTWAKHEDDKIVLKKSNIAPSVFLIILDKNVAWDQYDSKDILEFLVSADELLFINEVGNKGQHYLIKKRYKWILQNLDLVTFISFKYDVLKKLKEHCIKIIPTNSSLIFGSNYFFEYFIDFDEKLWINILLQEYIQIEEFEIWNYLIKWGIEQSPKLNFNISDWSKNDFKILQNRLSRLILFIRFTEFTIEQFFSFVIPFKDILNPNLIQDILYFQNTCILNPLLMNILKPRKPKITMINSNIITLQQAAQIIQKIPITIDQTKTNSNDDLNVNSDSYCNSDDSFIFSFDNEYPINAEFSSVQLKLTAIRDNPALGPCFGKTDIFMTQDFRVFGNCTSKPWSYKKIFNLHKEQKSELTKRFSIVEYEVFQVIFKRDNQHRWISFMHPRYFVDDKYVGPNYN